MHRPTAGDIPDPAPIQIRDKSGNPQDITNWTITKHLRKWNSDVTKTTNFDVLDATIGLGEWRWEAGDLDEAGYYFRTLTITDDQGHTRNEELPPTIVQGKITG